MLTASVVAAPSAQADDEGGAELLLGLEGTMRRHPVVSRGQTTTTPAFIFGPMTTRRRVGLRVRGATVRGELRLWNRDWAGVRLTTRVGLARDHAVLRRTTSGFLFASSEYETVQTARVVTGGLAAGPVFRGGRFTISPGARWDVTRATESGFARSTMDELLWVPPTVHGLTFEMVLALQVVRGPSGGLLLTLSTSMGVTIVEGHRTRGAYGLEIGLLIGSWSSPNR